MSYSLGRAERRRARVRPHSLDGELDIVNLLGLESTQEVKRRTIECGATEGPPRSFDELFAPELLKRHRAA